MVMLCLHAVHDTDRQYRVTKLHFESLFYRYGSPVLVLNLIKKQEKKAKEALLGKEFSIALHAINQVPIAFPP